MSKITLTAKGLYTDPNQLGSIPNGAMSEADNVVIDRIDVVDPRRGFNQFGNAFGIGTDRSKQLLSYKDRILIHYNDKLLYNSNPHDNTSEGSFLQFSGSYSELESGLRIKGIESNKNFYFTTNDGVKKIAASTAADFTTASGFIVDSGVSEALDLNGTLNFNSDGFLPANSKVAYRLVWGYKDINNNVILGSPSSRLVITNYSNVSANVDLEAAIPSDITSSFFYQIYRTGIFTASGSLTLDLIDPGDDMNLVIEDFPTSAQISSKIVTVTDIAPDDFRAGGTPLYTSPNIGDGTGISGANERPPKAKDLSMYQSTVFYANTETKANTIISLLGVTSMVSGTSSITIQGTSNETYTFVGVKEKFRADFSSYSGVIPTNLNGKYWLLNSSSNNRSYYVWYDNTKTTQTLDFSGYVGSIPSDLDGRWVILNTPLVTRKYYVWFDSTGTTSDPGLNPANTTLVGLIGIRVDISSGVTNTIQLASATASAITTNNVYNDYDINYSPGNSFLTLDSFSFDDTGITAQENIQKGFQYTISTPVNLDPANDLITHTDVIGRTGFKVSISRGISTLAQLADATAAAIADQDSAQDFLVSYTTSNTYLDVENTNNGKTTDASDSLINGVGLGFSITITTQGDGENPALNHVLLSAASSPSQQIDETARSLVRVINKNINETVYAFYISGPNDVPGQILLKVKDIGTNAFSVIANDATTGALFNPSLPPVPGAANVTGQKEIKPNRVYYAKVQQPEAVPSLNYLDIGPEDKEISRIIALRESLFVLKKDGVYRITGSNGAYRYDLFDGSIKIIAPDSAVVVSNQIYCLTNQGIVRVSDTGIEILSKPIDNIIKVLSSSNYNYKYTSFGISYETDRAYILWLPKATTDTVATQAYRYNTVTNAWTRYSLHSKTCGLVNQEDGKLYLGAGDENFIERERKNFDRTDYADRDYSLSIPQNGIDGSTITLSSSQNASVGDAIVQKQYLTIRQYNQLLAKIDLDPFVGSEEQTRFDFTSYSQAVPSSLHTKYFILYSASDVKKYCVFFDAIGTVNSLSPIGDISGSVQIRVDITSATTLADVVNLTQNKIKSSTLDFVVQYTSGNTFFITTTVKAGSTSNATDGTNNPISNGFTITILTQGFGDYNTLNASPGVNLITKLTELANKLDLDPSVNDNNYLASISTYSGSGTAAIGNPSVITSASHNLQTGRMITISSSTTVPSINGSYVITKIDNNSFSINTNVTTAGNLSWVAQVNTFPEIQAAFNTIVNKLNSDTGVFFTNYKLSSGTTEQEALIIQKIQNSSKVIMEFELDFVQGNITLYKAIATNVVYSPETFGDPSMLKQISEATVMFENANFTMASVGYRTDLSPGFESIDFNKQGKGNFGQFIWSNQNWGGGYSGVPFRTYIPSNKQRCRYMQVQFEHSSAREICSLFGISFAPPRIISNKAYR